MNSPAIFRTRRHLKPLVTLLAPLVLISIFLAFQTSSGAQTLECAGNLLRNGTFSNGVVVVGNGNFPPSTVPNWTSAFQTPQVSAATGCGNPGFIVMWGNKGIGEGIRQTVNIQAGRRYRLSACVRWVQQPTNPSLPPYVRFNVRAANWPITYIATAPTAPSIGIIGSGTNITSTTWTNVTLADWTAPANFSSIVINPENDSTNNNGQEVSWGAIDNLCLQEVSPPNFEPPNPCGGQPAQFNGIAPGATSWDWDFGDNTPHSNLQNPTHIFANTSPFNVTFNVKLCVPGGSNNCVTKPVTVKPAPPVPTINGPNSAFTNQPATYSVSPAAGVAYSWTISNGAFVGPSTGLTVNVTWGPLGVGIIAVTATNKAGCSSTTRMRVTSGSLQLGECCNDFKSEAELDSLVPIGGGVYNVNTTFSTNQSNIVRVTANIISTSLSFSSAACGTAGPVDSYVTNAFPVGNFQPSTPVQNGDEVIWHGPPASVNGANFSMQIKFPPPPPPKGKCSDSLSFCVKYTFTTDKCKTCEVVRCYGPFKRGGPSKEVSTEVKETILTP